MVCIKEILKFVH